MANIFQPTEYTYPPIMSGAFNRNRLKRPDEYVYICSIDDETLYVEITDAYTAIAANSITLSDKTYYKTLPRAFTVDIYNYKKNYISQLDVQFNCCTDASDTNNLGIRSSEKCVVYLKFLAWNESEGCKDKIASGQWHMSLAKDQIAKFCGDAIELDMDYTIACFIDAGNAIKFARIMQASITSHGHAVQIGVSKGLLFYDKGNDGKCLGPALNIAARLAHLGYSDKIVIHSEFLADTATGYICKYLDRRDLKGICANAEIYEICSDLSDQ